MKRYVYITLALLALMAGQAHAQRCLPGMKGVRLTAEMADGFYCGANRHDAGYAFSLAVSTYTKKGNQWVFGGETLRRNLPYRNTHIPTAQYTGEGGYYHTCNLQIFLCLFLEKLNMPQNTPVTKAS